MVLVLRALQRHCLARAYTTSIPYIMSALERYDGLSRGQLLQRIAQLEANASAAGIPSPTPAAETTSALSTEQPQKKKPRPFDVKQYPCRKIALRFSYDGAYYSGLAAQPAPTPLPTVEEMIWNAMCTARLVDAAGGMESADWSRCGRTDAGVSAAGQVIALWVRSRRVDERALKEHKGKGELPSATVLNDCEELPYVATLNRLLPQSIRIQAWSPVSHTFSARFDCTYRHYKYFFTLGAPGSLTCAPESGAHFVQRLSLERMRDAAARLVGEHDFRNMCKVDASKQITNFCRRIDGATIDAVPAGWGTGSDDTEAASNAFEPMYVLNLRGSAFLYHQVRHIMSVLFMVGAGLEEPCIVDELVNVEHGAAAADRIRTREWLAMMRAVGDVDASTPEKLQCLELEVPSDADVFETKPSYEMAADRPLMLWECGFRESDVAWRASAYDGRPGDGPNDYSAALRAAAQLHSLWTREAIHTELVRHMLFAGSVGHGAAIPTSSSFSNSRVPHLRMPGAAEAPAPLRAQLVPLGNGASRPTTRYRKLRDRPRDVPPSEKNARWLEGKGRRRAERRAEDIAG